MNTDTPETVRTFVSLPAPEGVERAVQTLVRRLDETMPRGAVRWVPKHQLHLTLQFLGNVPANALPELGSALRQAGRAVRALNLKISGLGCFPGARQPRVLWVGLDGDLQELAALQQEVARACEPWVEKPDNKPFRPHLTIGRVRFPGPDARRIGAALEQAAPPETEPWIAPELFLMRSDLGPQGATHSTLERIPLGAA